MSTPHTPGPWKIHTEKGKIGILTENNVDHLATCYGFRKEQNARLIAAAPDLLDAIAWIAKQAELSLRAFPNMPAKHDLIAIMDTARAAIAKAKGAL